jgi:PAS domain S-box-containing protein
VSGSKYTRFLDVAPDAMIIVDDDGIIEYVNEQAEFMFHYKRDALIGKPIEVLLPARYRHAHVAQRNGYIAEPLRRPMGEGFELFGLRADGTEIAVDVSLAPIESEDGPRYAAAIRDVTAQKQAVRVIGQTVARTIEWLSQLDEALTHIAPRRKHP